jgi:hypothetical protein
MKSVLAAHMKSKDLTDFTDGWVLGPQDVKAMSMDPNERV